MRRLHEKQLRIAGEMPDRLTQERFERHVVGVEHDDDRRLRMREAVVEIARLGVLVACPREIVRAELVAQHAQRRAARLRFARLDGIGIGAFLVGAAVVEQPHLQLAGRIVHRPRGRDGHGQDLGVLVVARDEDVDLRQIVLGHGGRIAARHRVGIDDEAHRENVSAVELGEREQRAEGKIDEVVGVGQRLGRAPVEVTQHDEGAEREERPSHVRTAHEGAHQHHRDDDRRREAELGADPDRLPQERERDDTEERPRDPAQDGSRKRALLRPARKGIDRLVGERSRIDKAHDTPLFLEAGTQFERAVVTVLVGAVPHVAAGHPDCRAPSCIAERCAPRRVWL